MESDKELSNPAPLQQRKKFQGQTLCDSISREKIMSPCPSTSLPSWSLSHRSYLASGNCFNPIGEVEGSKLHLFERVSTLITMCFRHSRKDDYKMALS